MIQVLSRKFYNQFSNGELLDTDLATVFTHYPLAWVTGKHKRVTEIEIFNETEADGETWVLVSSGGVGTLVREAGSFLDEGWNVGDTFFATGTLVTSGAITGFGTITTALDDTLIFDIDSGTFPSGDTVNIVVFLTTKQLGISYFSNTVENQDPASFVSRVDGSSDRKFTVELTEAEYDANTEVDAIANGIVKSWKQDTVTATNLEAADGTNNWRQRFKLTEIFTVAPFFDTSANLENDVQAPEYAGANSPRHIIRVETIPNILNPIVVHQLEDSDVPLTYGSMAYYNERFNGILPVEFTPDGITYLDGVTPVNQLLVDKATTFTATISSLSGVFVAGLTKFHLNVFFLNEGTQDPAQTIVENFVLDEVFHLADGSLKAGLTILTDVSGIISAGKLVVTGTVTYSAAQQALIDGGKYAIVISTNDHTTTIDNSLLVPVLMDVEEYDRDANVPDLMGIDTSLFYEHPHDIGAGGTSNFIGWNEDGIVWNTDWWLDLSKSSVIRNMDVRIVAFNSSTGDFFEFDPVSFDFTSVVVSGGSQQINVDTTRGFKLETITPSQFNLQRILLGALVGTKQHYTMDIAFKFPWMDWLLNSDVHPDFFDLTLLNDGKNQKIDRYSGANGYAIKMFIDAQVEGLSPIDGSIVVTNYRFRSPDLTIYDYDQDNTGDPSTNWVQTKETFDQSANDLTQNLHGAENTDIKITYTLQAGAITSSTIYTVIRLEEYQQGGLVGIFELSSKRDSIAGNPLVPLAGETKTKNTVGATTVISECAVDYTLLNPASQYKISGRLGSEDSILSSDGKQKTDGTTKQKTDATVKEKTA